MEWGIHDEKNLSNVSKINFFEAYSAVKGLKLQNDNQDIRDNHSLILAKINKLLLLDPILNMSDSTVLRTLCDAIKTPVHCLNILG